MSAAVLAAAGCSAGTATTVADGGTTCTPSPLSACPSQACSVTPLGGIPDAAAYDGSVSALGDLPPAECAQLCTTCASSSGNCRVSPDAGGTVDCLARFVTGRRPEGLCDDEPCATRGAELEGPGEHLAEVARLEAASVFAFRVLARELEKLGAPKRLVHAARRSARDEVRHTRSTGALARRYGSSPRAAVVAAPRARSLEDIATENAIEGCVREAYGALAAHWQAHASGDAVVRAAMQRIARDETRHAALAWRVHGWAISRLDTHARSRVRAAQRAAAAQLVASVTEPSRALRDELGVPSARAARALASALAASVARA